MPRHAVRASFKRYELQRSSAAAQYT